MMEETVKREDLGFVPVQVETLIGSVPSLHRDPSSPLPAPVPDPLAVRSLREIMQFFDPDLIHVHGWSAMSVAQVAKDTSIPTVVTLHDHGFVCPKRTFLRSMRPCWEALTPACIGCALDSYSHILSLAAYLGLSAFRRCLSRFTRVVCVSRYLKNAHAGYLDTGSWDVIHNFYSRESPPTLHQGCPDPEQARYVFIGSTSPGKGIDILLRAWKQLTMPAASLTIALSDRQTPNIELEDGRVGLVWNPSRDRLLQILKESHILVVPSVLPEACPTVVLEGLAYGLCVVGSAVGGIPELLDFPEGGLLVNPGNPTDLARGMAAAAQSLTSYSTDAVARVREFDRRYSADSVIERLLKLYRETVEAR